jgi:phage replication-related protein YjqB (UPF0714/DUF867 family)
MATARTSVKRAHDSQDDLKKRAEHCSADAQALAAIGRDVRQQVRVHLVHDGQDEFALFTVSELQDETPDEIVRMGLVGRRRLRTEKEFEGVLDSKVVDQRLDDGQAREAGELVERLCDDGSHHLIVIAPHGGDIEPGTDEQARHVANRLRDHSASLWLCRGWRPGGGAFARWHITSTEIHPAGFPLLTSVMSRRFTYAVAFHGFDGPPDVLIGGTAPPSLKLAVREAISAKLEGKGVEVRVATPDDVFGGDDPENLVNRLTIERAFGIQIEQSEEARDRHGQDIAEAVADVYASRLVPLPSRRTRSGAG